MATICVVGLGYVGLPTAALLAARGHRVIGVDVNPETVKRTNEGRTSHREVGLHVLLQAAVKSGNFVAKTAAEEADVFFICVPTPREPGDRNATLAAVKAAAGTVAPKLRRGNLIVLESTVPPGTTEDVLRPLLEKESGLAAGKDFHLAYCPERLLPGDLLHELVANDRIVGGIDEESARRAKALYETFVTGAVVTTKARTAEMVKLMENTWGAVNIALVNEFAQLAEKNGVDVHEAIALANRHPRVRLMKPGPGVGGHCIPVDPWFLVDQNPTAAKLIRTALEVNDSMPTHVLAAAKEAFRRAGRPMRGAKVVLLGVAYKGNIGDPRGTPALPIAEELLKEGATVAFHDPLVEEFAHPVERDLSAAAREADALIVVTDHNDYRELATALPRLRKSMRSPPILLDGRNVVTKAEGFVFWRLGVGFVS